MQPPESVFDLQALGVDTTRFSWAAKLRQFPLTYKRTLRIASLATFIRGMRLTYCYVQIQSKNKSRGLFSGLFSP